MALQVIDEELFNKIRKDWKLDNSFERVLEEYGVEEELLKDILDPKSYEEFCEEQDLQTL